MRRSLRIIPSCELMHSQRSNGASPISKVKAAQALDSYQTAQSIQTTRTAAKWTRRASKAVAADDSKTMKMSRKAQHALASAFDRLIQQQVYNLDA